MPIKPPTLVNWIMLFNMGVILGASFMATKVALGGYGPLTITAGRLTIAAAFLVTASYIRGTNLPSVSTQEGRIVWVFCIALGAFTNALPFTLLNWAQLRVSSGFAGVTMAAVPLLVLPLAHVLVPGERMHFKKLAGFIVGFTGVVILIGPDSVVTSSGDVMEPFARFACLGAAACYATGTILMRLSPSKSMVAFSAGGLMIGALIMVPVALYFEGLPEVHLDRPLLAVLFLGLLPTAAVMLMLVHVVKTAGPTFMSLVNYQIPVWAVILGISVLHETLPPSFFTALVLILAGLAISQYRRRRIA